MQPQPSPREDDWTSSSANRTERLIDRLTRSPRIMAIPQFSDPSPRLWMPTGSETLPNCGARPQRREPSHSHRSILRRYEEQSVRLESSRGVSEGDVGATEAIPDLVEKVILWAGRDAARRVSVDISERLNSLRGEETYVKGLWGTMVAGERYRLSPRQPNIRFLIQPFADGAMASRPRAAGRSPGGNGDGVCPTPRPSHGPAGP